MELKVRQLWFKQKVTKSLLGFTVYCGLGCGCLGLILKIFGLFRFNFKGDFLGVFGFGIHWGFILRCFNLELKLGFGWERLCLIHGERHFECSVDRNSDISKIYLKCSIFKMRKYLSVV